MNESSIQSAVELARLGYEDLLKPGARELGTTIETALKTVNVLLRPYRVLILAADRFVDGLEATITKKLVDRGTKQVKSPDPSITGQALTHLAFVFGEEQLREMYANLLASAIDVEGASIAHPGFVEIIRQLTPDEAKLLTYLALDTEWKFPHATFKVSALGLRADCARPELVEAYLSNFQRLGLFDVGTVVAFDTDPQLTLGWTTYGLMFRSVCVEPLRAARPHESRP